MMVVDICRDTRTHGGFGLSSLVGIFFVKALGMGGFPRSAEWESLKG